MSGGRLAAKLGFPEKQKERSLWVLGATREAFEAAAPVIEAVAARYARLVIVLSGPDALLDWLAGRFPACVTAPRPAAFGPAVRRFVRRANFRAVAALDDLALEPALIAGMADEGLTLIALAERTAPAPAVIAAAERVLAVSRDGLDAVVGRLGEALGRDIKIRRKRARKPFSLASWLLAALDRPRGRRLLKGRLERIPDSWSLGGALKRPATILCLGNGPSSEDPRIAGVGHDALFRVNHSWAERGFLTQPNVVFTGGTRTMATLDGVIFGVQSEGAERRLVATRLPKLGRKATRFFRVPAVAPALVDHPWGSSRPTNGAAMLAAAVALKPERLVVAGIDLFRHPDGAYPGDPGTPNAFAPAHDADAELTFILRLFEDFQGEITVFGDVLAEAWRQAQVQRGANAGLPKAGA